MQTFAHQRLPPSPEPVRPIPVRGTWAYLDRLGVGPGEALAIHVSAEAAHDIEVVRLGRCAVIDPAQSLDDDRREAEVLAAWAVAEASPQTIHPGSYLWIGGDPVAGDVITLGLWLRLWRLPVIDVLQVAWQGLITDIDYPDAARFGLLVDHLGRFAVYLGDGGPFRHDWLHHTPPLLHGRLGTWAHVAATWSTEELRVFVDGEPVLHERLTVPAAPAGAAARLRIGAMAEGGVADDLLDGDIAMPFAGAFLLDEAGARHLHADGDLRAPGELGLGPVLACWPLGEENGAVARDATGNGRDARIANHGTWMIGGPRFAPADRRPGLYQPAEHAERGHGLRLSSDDLMDAAWPVARTFEVPAEARSGLYAVRVRLAGQAEADACVAPFVVVRRRPRREGSIALLAATNTWHAYGRRSIKEQSTAGLGSSFYTRHANGRPFFHLGLRLPIPCAQPYAFESRRSTRTRATHLVRTERFMEAWLTREGYPFEVVTDLDLHEEPDLLKAFRALVIVGHSEYWSDEARAGVLRFLDGGGRLLSLSGDTMTVRVTLDPERAVMECRKIVFDEDERWLPPRLWGESWHAQDGLAGGTYRRLGKPNWEVLGLGFKGMIDDGAPTAFASYTVLEPQHFLFHEPAPVPIGADGTIGRRCLNGSGGASGYEFDSNLDRSGLGPGPLPGVTTLASALGQTNLEWLGERDHGADLIYWRRPAGGTVVNFGSIGAAGALPVDPGMAQLVRNTLAHFDVPRTAVRTP